MEYYSMEHLRNRNEIRKTAKFDLKNCLKLRNFGSKCQ